ncbi:2Fe-2S iron-sulfur cluster binding domain-containing protein [Cohnella pontilimi]|uniref:2Fe-2S iron-sulfur cluster binding domain-containing protein n=1 Tax=Cohnella pontilimi TaxID=2564100 RepID=A0A4U0FH64_9BACL|nr:2Fe-2S iron-sulfur cluster-binding protein [Cohnella pontilimi]TJY44356.1 2Fe-2S iron-sulfur cluster binding domain-containing protein [Cohnella pontilimi]
MSGNRRVTFLPEERSIEVRPGTTLLDASKRARVAVRTRCDGMASCLMCKVNVDPDQAAALQEPTPAEKRMLGGLLGQGIRLSCQARVKADVTVTVPEDPLKSVIRQKLAEQQREKDELW